MQRSNQFNGIKSITQFLFESSDDKREISELVKKWSDETYNIYLKTEVFNIDNNTRTEEEILEKISQVEFLQDVVEQYLKKKNYGIELLEDEYKGIALIYELCIKILQVVKNKLGNEYQLYEDHINKGLIYNSLLCSIYYFCGREIGMGQMIAEFFDKFDITSKNVKDDDFQYMIKLIDFFSLRRSNEIDDELIKLFNNFSVRGAEETNLDFNEIQFSKIRDCIGPDIHYFKKGLNVLRDHSLQLYFQRNGGSNDFKAISKFNERFLLPGQLEVLKIIDQNNIEGVKSNIVTMPTSAGKSLVAELQIAKSLKKFPEKYIIYIAPKVALCDQITEDLKKRFGEIIEESYDDIFEILGIETSEAVDHTKTILVLTPEKFLGLMGREQIDLNNISLIIFDEFHNITSVDRGPKMELMMNIVKLKKKQNNLDIQILLMSAIISNGEDILTRLGEIGEVAKSDMSPTRKHVFYGLNDNSFIYTKLGENSSNRMPVPNKNIIFYNHNFLVKLRVLEKIFIFRNNPAHFQSTYNQIKENFESILDNRNLHGFSNLFNEQREKDAIMRGIGFIYRNIPEFKKVKMIELFKKNELKVIIGNTTIIDGVNLDIEYLILGDHQIQGKNLTQSDIHNMFGRSGRFPFQTDGFVFMNTFIKPFIKPTYYNKINVIEQIYYSGNNIESQSVNQEGIIEQYFLIRLSSQDIELVKENIDQIIQNFQEELMQYFIGYNQNTTRLNRAVNSIINKINLRSNFLRYQRLQRDRFYKITGMSQGDTRNLLDKYNGILKEYRISTTTTVSGCDLDDLLPEGFYPIIIEDKTITWENKNTHNDYLIPWILNSYQRKVENDNSINNDQKYIISEKIKQCILRIKYKVRSLEALRIIKKHHFSPELSNYLADKDFDGGDDEKISKDTLIQIKEELIQNSDTTTTNIQNEIDYIVSSIY